MNNHGLFFRMLCFLADCIKSGWACSAAAMRFARSENVNVESVQRFFFLSKALFFHLSQISR